MRQLTGYFGAILVAAVLLTSANAQAVKPWRDVKISPSLLDSVSKTTTNAARIRITALDAEILRRSLRSQPVVVSFPLPGGSYSTFRVTESTVLSAQMAALYPDIKTYAGTNVMDGSETIRFELSAAGFRAAIFGRSGTVTISPVGSDSNYAVAFLSDLNHSPMKCDVKGENTTRSAALPPASSQAVTTVPVPAPFGQLKTYRLAVSTSAEFAARTGGTPSAVTATIASIINRVNAIYARDLNVNFTLVKTIVLTDAATQPFKDTASFEALALNQVLLDAQVGSANYDIGHLFVSQANSGFGMFEGLCNNALKGEGVSPLGVYTLDDYALEMVAHEIGHQLSAFHTFNSGGSPGCSDSQRTPGATYEVGSGVTIMSYAGICGGDDPQDLDTRANGYFHAYSIYQMNDLIRKRPGCEQPVTGTATNGAPAITTPAAFTIPARTPFQLSARVIDPNPQDQGNLTYSWEEFDLGTLSPPNTDDGSRPLFRNYSPVKSPTRFFPSMQYILNNQNVPPATFTNGNGKVLLTGEQLPTTTRTMAFRLAVRDNRSPDAVTGGTQSFADVGVSVRGDAGPFQLSNPNTASVSWTAGSKQTVTWDVAKTDLDPISCKTVTLALSLDGGLTYPITLGAGLPNNGSAAVTVPATIATTTHARVRISGDGNIFFDVSGFDFNVAGSSQNPPKVGDGGIVNAASFAQTIVPGTLFSIFGANLASGMSNAAALPLPTVLSGAVVQVNGQSIPLIFVSPGQINAQLPYEIQPGTASLVVMDNGVPSPAVSFTVSASGPGIFTYGNKHAVVINATGAVNAADQPARVGSVVVAYLTGSGVPDTPVVTGDLAPSSPLARVQGTVAATIGGINAPVQFAGLTPGFVGLLQLNIAIPQLVAGDYPLVVSVNGAQSNSAVVTVAP